MLLPLVHLKWLGTSLSEARIGAAIGVAQSTISRYLTGITPIPWHRQSAISLFYERTQYAIARSIGYPDLAAANLRGLSPEVFQSHIGKAVGVLERWAEGRLAQKIIREDIDIFTVDLDALYDEMLAQAAAEMRTSDIDWRDLETEYARK